MGKYIRIITRYLLGILILACLSVHGKTGNIPSLYINRNQISLNRLWKFKYFPSSEIGPDSLSYQNVFDTRDWSDIKIPGHWDLQGFAEPSERSVPEATGLYRTSFKLPLTMKG